MTKPTQLRGITWNHTRGYAPMAVTAQVFADRNPGVEIAWDRRSLWAFGEQSLDDLVRTYDLLVLDHPMIGRAAQSALLLPLDGYVPADLLDRLRHGTVGSSQDTYHDDGHDYALATDAACQVAVARTDLLAELGADVPTRWDEVLDLARSTGRVALPLNAIDVLSAFLTLCAHLGAPMGQDGDQCVQRDTGLEALALLRELRALVDDRCHEANPIAVLNRMSTTDEIVYCPLAFGYTNYSRAGYAPRPLRFFDIPRVRGDRPAGSCLGGAGLAVSAASAHCELAVEYAAWVADPETQRTEYVRAGGQPAATLAWDDPVANQLTGDFFSSTRATIDAAYVRPRNPGVPDFQTDAADLLRRAVLSDQSPGGVLDALDELYRDRIAHHATGTQPR